MVPKEKLTGSQPRAEQGGQRFLGSSKSIEDSKSIENAKSKSETQRSLTGG